MAKRKGERIGLHVEQVNAAMGGGKFPATPALRAAWARCLGRLKEAARCAEYGTLVPAIAELDALRALLDATFSGRRAAGLAALRQALAGTERFLDSVPLAPPGTPLPTPHEALETDLPPPPTRGRVRGRAGVATVHAKATRARPPLTGSRRAA